MNKTKCNLCGSSYYKVVYDIKAKKPDTQAQVQYKITGDKSDLNNLKVVRCLKCGLVYASVHDSHKEILSKYCSMEDPLYIAEEKGRRAAARLLLNKLIRFRRKGRILDVGCAAGFLLDEAKKLGWEVSGVELSSWAVKYAKQEFGLNVFEGGLKDAGFAYNYFDAVVMTDVIEHLPDPRMVLEEARRILKTDGILCISTPDIESLLSKILGAKWWGIQQSHLFYFSRKTINRMLDAAGFKVIKYSPYARVFSSQYLASRLSGYNSFVSGLFGLFAKYIFPKDSLLKINFYDQVVVFAKKKRSLSFIHTDEIHPVERNHNRKMKTIVVLPAYNAAKTLPMTIKDIPKDLVDDIILVDDASKDDTVKVAKQLGIKVFMHRKNMGYGANQKTCYSKALEAGAEIIVMVHPDYQYDPTIIPKLIEPIQKGEADAVFGSRMIKGGALEGGMPLWKHNVNILLTALENVVLGTYLTEYHSGFRAYSSKYLRQVNFMRNSDNFVFDNEIIVQGALNYLKIEEVPIKTRYFDEASSIKLIPSIIYGVGILKTLLKYLLHKHNIIRFKQFE
ncbi:MAG: methyltransferase domain-containing protein [Candidatus Omnitrophica bacterium]|nr:methyltransferase domain-containing protein [Candidatus Omnitrophota bacterium]